MPKKNKKTYYDKKARDANLNVGDYVYRFIAASKVGQSPKFIHPWKGPFEIMDVRYPNVQLRCSESNVMKWVHVNLLKKAPTTAIPKKVQKSDIPVNKSLCTPNTHPYNLRRRT